MRRNPGWIAAGGAALGLVTGSAWAQPPSGSDGYAWGSHMMGWGGGWFGMVLAPIFMIIFLALVIAVAVLLVRWLAGPSPDATPPPQSQARAPLDIL